MYETIHISPLVGESIREVVGCLGEKLMGFQISQDNRYIFLGKFITSIHALNLPVTINTSVGYYVQINT